MKKAAFIAWKSELLDIVYPIVVAMKSPPQAAEDALPSLQSVFDAADSTLHGRDADEEVLAHQDPTA
jgi:hypothetical protein